MTILIPFLLFTFTVVVLSRRQARINAAMKDTGPGPEGSGPYLGENLPGPYCSSQEGFRRP